MPQYGIVENRLDPLKLGRCQVRVIGLHTPDKLELPTSDLPWALVMQPSTSAAMNGIGHAPVGFVPGTWVIVDFLDEHKQQPIILGSIGGIPDETAVLFSNEDETINLKDDITGEAVKRIAITTNGHIESNAPESTAKSTILRSGGSDTSDPPSSPPEYAEVDIPLATAGIETVLSGCSSAGYTEKIAKASILAGIGALDGWMGTSESITAQIESIKKKIGNVPQNDIRFYYSVCRILGSTTPENDALRDSYFEYFVGKRLPRIERTAGMGDVRQIETGTGSVDLPGGERYGNLTYGFSDPDGKYPLREKINEADTNRLARGVVEGTVVELKDNGRICNIKTAFGGSYDQPPIPYSANYPYNHVYESESGHLFELDDTPLRERVHLYHRSGTFSEIDANGTQVNRIVGDGYTIIERNGMVYIAGACNVTVDGNVNILCQSNVNLEVMGDVKADLRGKADLRVANDATLSVGGNMTAAIVGKCTLDVTENLEIKSAKDILFECMNFNVKSIGCNLLGTGAVSFDGGGLNLLTGTAAAACSSISISTSLTPTLTGEVIGTQLSLLETPPRNLYTEVSLGETPDEFEEVTVKKLLDETVGLPSNELNTVSSSSAPAGVASIPINEVDTSQTMSMPNFQSSYVLSPRSNITIATMTVSDFPQSARVQDVRGGPYRDISAQEVVANMQQLAVNVLEKIYDVAGKKNIVISSGFRTSGRSKYSADHSDHNKGRAIDFQIVGKPTDGQAHFDLIQKLSTAMPYDQLILEYRDPKPGGRDKKTVWIHVSYRGKDNRRQAFTMLNDKKYTGNGDAFHLIA